MLSIPFPGNKKDAYKSVRKIFIEGGYRNVLEPFGGSCVLSVNLKNDGLADKAVINDYDGLFDLYPEYLDIKDWIREEFHRKGWYRTCHNKTRGGYIRFTNAEETEWEPVKSRSLRSERREFLQSLVSKVDKKYWRLLSTGANFCHPGVPTHEKITLKDFAYFYAYVYTDRQRAYLKAAEKCERWSLDWMDFLAVNKDLLTKDTLLIIDPPYFGRANNQYAGSFTEDDTRGLLKVVKDLGCNFVFFNSDPGWMDNALEELGFSNAQSDKFGDQHQTVNGIRRECMAYVKRRERPKQLSFMK